MDLVRDPQGKLDPKGFLPADQSARPADILAWFIRRWSTEVTFEEVRRHLGVETQRQWSDLAIERTTPCLLGLFSLVTLMADQLERQGRLSVRQTCRYVKEHPTFSDAIAAVRGQLWQTAYFRMSRPETDVIKIPRPLFEHLTTTLAYAA